MNSTDTRRARLKEWLGNHPTPPKEKSYFSQLVNGTASFGERAARRIERQYGMAEGYLDRPLPGAPNPTDTAAQSTRNSQSPPNPSQSILRLMSQLTETQKAEIANTMQAMADRNERLLAELLARNTGSTS
ncbi:hypothetical protein [Caballeronia sp. HLA56]